MLASSSSPRACRRAADGCACAGAAQTCVPLPLPGGPTRMIFFFSAGVGVTTVTVFGASADLVKLRPIGHGVSRRRERSPASRQHRRARRPADGSLGYPLCADGSRYARMAVCPIRDAQMAVTMPDGSLPNYVIYARVAVLHTRRKPAIQYCPSSRRATVAYTWMTVLSVTAIHAYISKPRLLLYSQVTVIHLVS